MAAVTQSQAQAEAQVIRTAVASASNTANRVGAALSDIVSSVQFVLFGADLLDADETIAVSATGPNYRNQQLTSLTASRVKTLQAPTSDGLWVTIRRYDTSPNALTVRNGGAAGGDVTVSANTAASFMSGGGQWALQKVEIL